MPPTQDDLIAAYERMIRATAAEAARDAYIQANTRAEAAKLAFHTMAGEFCGGHP